jgi:crossover junction endodeoxyribonuclease RusA
MRTIEIHIPFPPTVNSYYGSKMVGRKKIQYIKPAGKRYREDVCKAVVEQVGYLELDDQLYVEVVLYPPDLRGRDLDNYMKALLDALTHAKFWMDDKQIDQLCIFRGRKVAGGLVTVKADLAGPILPPPR